MYGGEQTMKKSLLITILVVCMLVANTACGAKTQQTDSNSDPASAAETTAASATDVVKPAKDVQMRFSWWGSDARHEATIKVMENYNKKYPNVTIKGEYGGFDGYLEKMITQLAANSAPDIMQIDYAYLSPFWGQVDNFVDFNAQPTINMDGFSADMLKGITSPKGQLIGLPTGLNFSIVFANKALADKIGIDITQPLTWDKLLEDGKKVNAYNKDTYLLYPTSVNRYIFEPYLFNIIGKKLVSDDYVLGFDKDSLVKSFDYVMQLYKNKVLQPLDEAVTVKTPYENPRWLNEQLVMFPDFSSGFDPAMKTLPGQVVSLNPMGDYNAENTGIVLRPTNMLAAYSKSPNKDEALRFMDYFFNDQEAIDVLGLVRSVPSTTQALDRMVELGKLDAGLKSIADWDQTHKGGAGQNIISTNMDIETIENDILNKLYYGDITVDAAADQFIKLMTDKVLELKKTAAKTN